MKQIIFRRRCHVSVNFSFPKGAAADGHHNTLRLAQVSSSCVELRSKGNSISRAVTEFAWNPISSFPRVSVTKTLEVVLFLIEFVLYASSCNITSLLTRSDNNHIKKVVSYQNNRSVCSPFLGLNKGRKLELIQEVSISD